MVGLTGVMERNQNVGAGLPGAAGPALDDRVGSQAGCSDLLKHAACGVHNEHQRRGLTDTEQPAIRKNIERNRPRVAAG